MRLADLAHPSFRLVSPGVGGDEVLDADDIERAAATLAAELAHADVSGAVIELPAADARQALVGLAAAWQAGVTPLPNSRARGPSIVLHDGDAGDRALVLRTSGSTGAPRLPEFEADALVTSGKRIAAYLGLEPEDTVALLQPCDHGFGLIGQLFAAMVVGARAVWCGRPFAAERAHAVAAARATVVAAVPFGLAQLADHLPVADAAAVARIRQVGSAGGPLSADLARRLMAAFPRAVVWNQYGCTEAGPRLTAVPSTHPVFLTSTVGRPIPGVQVWIDDDGEIAFASDTAMRGYLGDAVATAAAARVSPDGAVGWTTGDLGVIDEQGRVHVIGRADDLVKIRGEKVSLERVARAALAAGAEHAVALAVPTPSGEPDPHLVIVYDAAAAITVAALVRHLPAGVTPRRLLWVPALPRLANGKIDRTTIEGLVGAGDAL